MLLNLSEQESNKLYRLSQDKATVEALKKFFLNQFVKTEPSAPAFKALEDSFQSLANVQPIEKSVNTLENMV